MRFFLLMASFGLVSAGLETTWLAAFPMQSLRLDLIIVAVAAVSFSCGWRQALPVLVFYGVIMDAVSDAPFGMSIFSYLIIYGFIRAIIAKISFGGGPALFFWVGAVSLMDKLLCSLVLIVSPGEFAAARMFGRYFPLQMILNATTGLFLVPFLSWYWDLTKEKIFRPKGLVLK